MTEIEYYEKHKVCPICGKRNFSTTLMACIFDDKNAENFKDRNFVECHNCGWEGIYDDLVSEKKNGVDLIAEERQRQIEKEGWTPEHDDKHTDNELANAAATYAMDSDCRDALMNIYDGKLTGIPPTWPWDDRWYKPTPDNRIKELVKAGALIVAEIDRLLRNEEKKAAN